MSDLTYHHRIQNFRVEPPITMTPPYGRGHVKARTDLSLRKAVDELGNVVDENAFSVVQDRDGRGVEKQGCDEGGNEGSGGSKTSLVNALECRAGVTERGNGAKGDGRDGKRTIA